MSDYQNRSNVGEQMKEALAQALRTGDFKDLNNLVNQTVTSTLNEVGKHISFENNENQAKDTNNFSQWEQDTFHAHREREEQKRQRQQQHWQEQLQRTQEHLARQKEQFMRQKDQFLHSQTPVRQKVGRAKEITLAKFNKVGGVSNILYKVFGGIGLGVTGIMLFSLFILWGAGWPVNAAGFMVNLIFMLIFFGLIHIGVGQGKRLKRARRYMELCDRRMYIETEALAASTGKSKRYVLKDLQKMLKLGIFPEGHLDRQKTCFMLNDAVYRQYLEMEEYQRRRALEQQSPTGQNPPGADMDSDTTASVKDKSSYGKADSRNRNSMNNSKNPDSMNPDSMNSDSMNNSQGNDSRAKGSEKTELDTMIAEGDECISKLRYLNDQIPGEVISAKLFRLENLLKEIFENLKEHPEQMHRMHKLMDYYLPTTLKLVEAYEDFDKISVPGPEIIAAKAEIENTLDTINQAFTELLNNLFQDTVLDVTTDAQVLKTMLAREGLMKEMDITKLNIDGGQKNEQ